MIIDGKAIAQELQEETRAKVTGFADRKPTLAVILVGDDPASKVYVGMKAKQCHKIGMHSIDLHLDAHISEEELLKEVERLNNDPEIDGILVQLPLPKHISVDRVIETISPEKDVDGFHPVNVGKMLIGNNTGFLPCTPHGIKVLLDRCDIEIEGKHVVIVGRSNIVGKPTAAILMQRAPRCNATVTVVHSYTHNLKDICRSADILIGAIGKPLFITEDMVKDGAVVIDVGINRVDDPNSKRGYRIVGDVDFETIKDRCSHITPVPGGVGPMTIAMLLHNTVLSYERRQTVPV